MSAKDIACCLSCHMTFGSHEELFIHSCAQIKVEVVEEEDTKQLHSIVQEDIRNEIDPNVVSESDSEYCPLKKKQKKINTKKKVNKQQKNGVRPGPKPSGRPSKEKYTCPVKDCNARYRGDSIGNHFQKNANLLALDDVLYAASEYQSTLQEKSSAEGFSDIKSVD